MRHGQPACPAGLVPTLKHTAAILVAAATLSGCLEIEPESISLTADVGETDSETITLTNTGNEQVTFTVTPPDIDFAVVKPSPNSVDVGPDRTKEIRVEAECKAVGSTGGAEGEIAIVSEPVSVRVSQNKTSWLQERVLATGISLDLTCNAAETGTRPSRLTVESTSLSGHVGIPIHPEGDGEYISYENISEKTVEVEIILPPIDSASVELSREVISPMEAGGHNYHFLKTATCHRAGQHQGVVRDRPVGESQWSEGAVLFVLKCFAAPGETGRPSLVSLELFQGPPIYKKDYRTGEVFPPPGSPVNLSRPERGGRSASKWKPSVCATDVPVGECLLYVYPSKDDAWQPENAGLATAIWGRRTALAVTVFHLNENDRLEVSARIGETDLIPVGEPIDDGSPRTKDPPPQPIVVDDGFETVTVFDIERALYKKGNKIEIEVLIDGSPIEGNPLALFGETVDEVRVTWVPIRLPGDQPQRRLSKEDAVQRMGEIASILPIGPFQAKIWPDEVLLPDTCTTIFCIGSEFNAFNYEHNSNSEIFFGYWDAKDLCGGGVTLARNAAIGGICFAADYPELPSFPQFTLRVHAHEFAHLFGLTHIYDEDAETRGAISGGNPATNDYPYPGGGHDTGPARGWDHISNRFVGPNDEPHHLDIMGITGPGEWVASDFSHQLMALRLQSWNTLPDEAPSTQGRKLPSALAAHSATDGQLPRSIAIAGSISPGGHATISLSVTTNNPPWTPLAEGEHTIIVYDSSGGPLHSEPVQAEAGHGDHAFWGARVPYFENAATVEFITSGGSHAERGISRSDMGGESR